MYKKTCLHDRHTALGALMQPFAGFEMPIQYSTIIEEHHAVRRACGVFDVSHMGEVLVHGIDAEAFVNHIFTNDVSTLPDGGILYGMMLYPDGGTVDDLLVYRFAANTFFIVVNASNIDKDVQWMIDHSSNYNVTITNSSESYGQLAIQGPQSAEVVSDVLAISCSDLAFYTSKVIHEGLPWTIISRTGYTGEDGFELYGSHDYIRSCWDKLMNSGRVRPCGLGCRDTLRFEVGLPLYGHELSEHISPIMAGLSIFCKLNKADFIGKDALIRQKAEGVTQKLRGIELTSAAIPRHGYKVLHDGKVVGEVTTGYHLISVDKSCAVALVNADLNIGDHVEVQIRKKTFEGIITKKKFYEKRYHK